MSVVDDAGSLALDRRSKLPIKTKLYYREFVLLQ